MSADVLLSRLERVRKLGPDRWMACCPAHPDKTPSLSIRETADGTVLVKCFAGCGATNIIDAIGLRLSDLFPASLLCHHGPRLRRPFYRDQVFEMVRRECGIVWLIGCDMHAQRQISEADYVRLCEALTKIERVAQAVYGY